MLSKHIILLVFALVSFEALAQSPCQPILSQAQAALNRGDTEQALRKLQDVEICDDTKVLTTARQRLQRAIFAQINEQRQIAITAQTEAERERELTKQALQQVEREKEVTQLALDKAQKLIEAFYFYDGKYALAYGESKVGGVKEDNQYYFIDENGDWVEKLSGWFSAEQFRADGFARVIGTNFFGQYVSCWLDTTGNYYQVAYQVDELKEGVQIADFSETKVGFAHLIQAIAATPQLERLILDDNQITGDTLQALLHQLAQLEHFTHLSLEGCSLKQLPDNIGQLNKLHSLNLIGNELQHLPQEFEQLKQLKNLQIDHNKFEHFPAVLTALQQLEKLTYYRNPFSPLSPEVFEMKNLTELAVSIDSVKYLPSAIGQLKKLRKLEVYADSLEELPTELLQLDQLEGLFISGGQLKVLPPEIGRLSKLKKLIIRNNAIEEIPGTIGELILLEKLMLTGNHITYLPLEIGRLTELVELDMSSNQLLELPDEIGQLEKLTFLGLGDNQLSGLPASFSKLNHLSELRLGNNQIDELQIDWSQFKALRLFYLTSNPLKALPAGLEELPLLKDLNLIGTLIEIEEISRLDSLLPGCHVSPKPTDLRSHYKWSKNYVALYEMNKKRVIGRNSSSPTDWHNISFYALFAGAYETAITAAQRTLEINERAKSVFSNMAFGYLLNNEWVEAEAIFLEWKDKVFPNNERLANEVFLSDLVELENAGITHPDFAKVRALFNHNQKD